MRSALFVAFIFALVLVSGCSQKNVQAVTGPTCEFESLSWACTAEETSDGVRITVRNDLGIKADNVRIALEHPSCEQVQTIGSLDLERSGTLTFRCAQRPLDAGLRLEYTLPSAFAGDPPRFTTGVLSVS